MRRFFIWLLKKPRYLSLNIVVPNPAYMLLDEYTKTRVAHVKESIIGAEYDMPAAPKVDIFEAVERSMKIAQKNWEKRRAREAGLS